MSPLQSTPVPARRASWRIRAATTRARTSAERARRSFGPPTSSTVGTGSTWQTRSMRSTSGPLSRRW